VGLGTVLLRTPAGGALFKPWYTAEVYGVGLGTVLLRTPAGGALFKPWYTAGGEIPVEVLDRGVFQAVVLGWG